MSHVWIENLTINDRPRSTQMCAHCSKACIEAVPRARLSFTRPETGEPDSAHLHIACISGFASTLLKAHATVYKEAMKLKGRKLA